MASKLRIKPLTAETWQDFEQLFGEKGACGGCWCMLWRLPHAKYESQKGDGNKRAMKKLVRSGAPVGVLGYLGETVVGWCSIGPRSAFPRLEGSRILAPVDEKEVWSISCLFIRREFRRKGLSAALANGAVDYAKKLGALVIEAYPQEPKGDRMPDAFAWTGLSATFSKAGFREVARRSPTRPIMRRAL
jgi:GNAT superfamily N-acetyltransferase